MLGPDQTRHGSSLPSSDPDGSRPRHHRRPLKLHQTRACPASLGFIIAGPHHHRIRSVEAHLAAGSTFHGRRRAAAPPHCALVQPPSPPRPCHLQGPLVATPTAPRASRSAPTGCCSPSPLCSHRRLCSTPQLLCSRRRLSFAAVSVWVGLLLVD